MIYQGKARYPVREAVLHCAAIKTGQFAHMRAFQVFATINRWHVERGWSGFGYHGLFMPDGEFFAGRPFDQIGAHVIDRNRGTLGFLMIESREIKEPEDQADYPLEFSSWFTMRQRLAVKAKLAQIGGLVRVSGHNDYAPKLCPGFKVQSADWL